MQRTITALVALITMLAVNVLPSAAQDKAKPVEPTSEAQEINERTDGSKNTPEPAKSEPRTETRRDPSMLVHSGETVNNIDVHGAPVTIEGAVLNDVNVTDGKLTLRPGASVKGRIHVEGGTFDASPGLMLPLSGSNVNSEEAAAPPPRKQGSPLEGQFALLVFGLFSALIMMVIAPRSAHLVSQRISLEPARCVVVGGLSALGLMAAQFINVGLFRSPIQLLWAPAGFLFAVASVVALVYGWLCGMRYVGDFVARRMGQVGNAGGLYLRTALGLGAFFAADSLLGLISTNLMVVGLLAQVFVAIMGLGAVITTGFGADPNWLSMRLRGEARWFSWGRK